MTLSFIFGKGQQYETPEELAKARASANGLLTDQPVPTDLGSGLNAIGRALLYRAMMNDIRASEKAGRDSAAAAFNPIAGAMSGPGAFPPPPSGASKVAQALAGRPVPKPDNPNAPSRFDFARADAAGAAADDGGLPDVPTMEAYIRQSAGQRGIDPDVAVRVARAEGLQRGTWQSNVTRKGVREPSYGPYQLLVGGKGTGFPEGVGNRFMDTTGLDPADPANWQHGIDFALDTAGKQGWGQWYGSRAAGIGPFQGIGTGTTSPKTVRPVPDNKRIPLFPLAGVSAPPAPALPAPRQIQDRPVADAGQAFLAAQGNLPAQGGQGGQFDLTGLPAAAGGTADTFDASKGPTLPMLFNALQNPWLNETQRGLVKREIERLTAEGQPIPQRQRQEPLRRQFADNTPSDTATGEPGMIGNTGGWPVMDRATQPMGKLPQSRLFTPTPLGDGATTMMVPSGSAAPGEGPAGDDENARIFEDRMAHSNKIISDYERDGVDPLGELVRGNAWIPDPLENYLLQDRFQKFDLARRDFINAERRREPGTAISPEELAAANQRYFPYPGMATDLAEQKRQNRLTAIGSRAAGHSDAAPAMS